MQGRKKTQAHVTKLLGVTQGYVSMTLKKAKEKVTDNELKKASPEAYVRKCWKMFLDTGEMPHFIDVEVELIIRELWTDLLPFTHWFRCLGELCRCIMRFYLFDEEKIEKDINKFKEIVTAKERKHFEEYYGNKLLIVQAVYVRLYMEAMRRKKAGFHDSDKAYTSIYDAAEKIAMRLKVPVDKVLIERFYPYFAQQRNKRIGQFYKTYTGKKLPK